MVRVIRFHEAVDMVISCFVPGEEEKTRIHSSIPLNHMQHPRIAEFPYIRIIRCQMPIRSHALTPPPARVYSPCALTYVLNYAGDSLVTDNLPSRLAGSRISTLL